MSCMVRLGLAACVCVALAAGEARGQTNIAVLDVARVFEQYELTRDLETRFESQRRAAADEADQRRDRVEQMRRALTAFDPDSDDYARREAELTRAEVEFQVWSTQTEKTLKAAHKRWLLRIYDNTRAEVAKLANERKIDLVVTYDLLTEDAPDSTSLRQQILLQKVIFHSDRIDLTDEVLSRLNAAYKASGGMRSLDADITPAQEQPAQKP